MDQRKAKNGPSPVSVQYEGRRTSRVKKDRNNSDRSFLPEKQTRAEGRDVCSRQKPSDKSVPKSLKGQGQVSSPSKNRKSKRQPSRVPSPETSESNEKELLNSLNRLNIPQTKNDAAEKRKQDLSKTAAQRDPDKHFIHSKSPQNETSRHKRPPKGGGGQRAAGGSTETPRRSPGSRTLRHKSSKQQSTTLTRSGSLPNIKLKAKTTDFTPDVLDEEKEESDEREGRSPEDPPSDWRLEVVRCSFIDGVSDPVLMSLLDHLLEQKVIADCEIDSVKGIRDKTAKARFVIDTVRKKGEAASSIMIEFLCEKDPFFSEHLGLKI